MTSFKGKEVVINSFLLSVPTVFLMLSTSYITEVIVAHPYRTLGRLELESAGDVIIENFTPLGNLSETIDVSLNYPNNNTWNTSQNITHGYTPIIYNGAFANCSLFTNKTGSWEYAAANATSINNNSVNYILFDYGGDYNETLWNIYCYDTTTVSNYSLMNFTLKIDATPPTPPTLTNQSNGASWVNLNIGSCNDDGSGVAKKLLYRNTTNIVNLTTEDSYNATGLSEFTLYAYNLSCLDNAGNYGSNSTTLLVNTSEITPPLEIPKTAPSESITEKPTAFTNGPIVPLGGDLGSGDTGLILLWDNGTAPTGWTCISCSSGDSFFQRIINASSTYNSQGGSDTHLHTATRNTSSAPSLTRSPGSSGNWNVSSGTQLHAGAVVPFDAASNLPPYRNLSVIKCNTGVPTTLPAGAIAIFNTSVPAGWTQYSELNGIFPRGSGSATGIINGTGGATSHNHTITDSLLANTSANGRMGTTTTGASMINHTHVISTSSPNATIMPPYIEVVFGKLTASGPIPDGMIGMFNATPTAGSDWVVVSGSGSTFYNMLLRGNSTYSQTGGSDTHTHNVISSATSNQNDTSVNRGSQAGTIARSTHTHDVNYTGFSTNSSIPAYATAILAYKIIMNLTNPQDNNSNAKPNDVVNFSMTVSINYGCLSGYIFSNNFTVPGTWQNSTWIPIGGCVQSATVWNNSYTATNPNNYGWKFYANVSNGYMSNSTDQLSNFSVKTLKTSWTVGSLTNSSTCIEGSPCQIYQNNNFTANATIQCATTPSSLSCGTVSSSIRYNNTGTTPNTAISTTPGDTPFYTASNSISCSTLSDTNSCQLNWTINATGAATQTRAIDVSSTSSLTNSNPPNNNTNTAYVQIIPPPVSLSFTVQIPRTGTDYNSSTSSPGTQTGTIYFNITSSQQKNVNPCVDAALTNCQTDTTSIFRFWNTGNVAETWTMNLSALPQTGLTLWGNSSGNSTQFVFQTSALSWIVNSSIPITTGVNWVDAWLYVNATDATPSTADRSLNHSTSG
jgi:hypothetical protein